MNPQEKPQAEAGQVLEALGHLTLNAALQPRTPWDSLDRIVGPLWPGEMWILAAATGNGKTTTLMNLLDGWQQAKRRVVFLSLEQRPALMRLYWSALRLNLPMRKVLENDLSDFERQRVRADLAKQRDENLVHFVTVSGGLTMLAVQALFDYAVDVFADVIVIDHLHHLSVLQGNDYQALRNLCHELHALAAGTGIPVVCGAQLHRDKEGDMLAPFLPPKPTAIQGGEVIRQVCHVALGLFRPLIETFGPADAQAVRMGKAKIGPLLEPHTIGVHVLKHRIRGEALGDVVKLRYEHGRITCRETEDRVNYEARNDL